MTQKHRKRQQDHYHLEEDFFPPSSLWFLLENILRGEKLAHNVMYDSV